MTMAKAKPSRRDSGYEKLMAELLQAHADGALEEMNQPLNVCDHCGKEMAFGEECLVVRKSEIVDGGHGVLMPLFAGPLAEDMPWNCYCSKECLANDAQ